MIELNVLIGIADLHCGCQIGLCPPSGAAMDEGGRYRPNKFQRKTWRWWREFWDDWVPMVSHSEKYGIVLAGDIIDNCHHATTTQWSHNRKDQANLAYEIMAPEIEKAAAYWQLRGTEAHGGAHRRGRHPLR